MLVGRQFDQGRDRIAALLEPLRRILRGISTRAVEDRHTVLNLSTAPDPSSSRPEHNAPLDARARPHSGARELAATFNILRASSLLAMRGPMPKYEDLRGRGSSDFFSGDEPPVRVVFVSHRWESGAHPDPRGSQADSIRAFLTAVRSVSDARQGSAARRRELVPSLLVHGVFQAAYFLERGIAF